MATDPATRLVNLMIEEIQNNQRLERCDELFAEDFVDHTPAPGAPSGRDGMREIFARTHIGFPDGRITVEDQISDGHRVWTRKVFTGTHTGDFAGLAPTGRVITYRVMDVLAVRDGKLTEHWSVVDRLDVRRQLGLDS
jgi:steroid delta-isomerase-like uncharacterized protein